MTGYPASLGIEAAASITRARTGRTSYLTEATLAGHNDPGAEAVALLFENIAAKSTA
jgi:dihydroxyacetone kinase